MLIGSSSLYGAASYYQGVNATNAAKKSDSSSDGLTESQLFTLRHAGLSASDYISSYLDFAEQRSPELLKSGAATDTFSVRFEGRTYSLAGKKLNVDFQTAKISDGLVVPLSEVAKAPTAPSSATGRLDLTA